MSKKLVLPFLSALLVVTLLGFNYLPSTKSTVETIVYHQIKAGDSDLHFYYLDNQQKPLRSIARLKMKLEESNETLRFAMNGGMYMEDNRPLGLYIEKYKTISKLNTRTGSGNFYMQPNGVFYLDEKSVGHLCKTSEFPISKKIKYATQSGPLLVVDGQINSNFTKGSSNLNFRNGVGIMADGSALFAISKVPINFYDFADFFKGKGCRMALYLDGFVSRMYLPEKNYEQLDGNFGVIIAQTR